MKSNIIVTTTNSIEGCCIMKYLKTICSNIVIGTNVFSDIAASFTDFFGGRSDTYRRKLDIIYEEALKDIGYAIHLNSSKMKYYKYAMKLLKELEGDEKIEE